jgi:hypothetical protein
MNNAKIQNYQTRYYLTRSNIWIFMLRSNISNHLNALADLEHIYRELHRMSVAERCRKTVSDIQKGDNPDYMNSRFISLLEQSYTWSGDSSIAFQIY